MGPDDKRIIYISEPAYRYVDDTFVIWPHGQEKLTEFLNHLNRLHNKIQFTMEKEEEGHLAFLDLDITEKWMAP